MPRYKGSRDYSDSEIGYLLDTMAMPSADVAEELGRPVKSVQYKRRQLREGWDGAKRDGWTVREDEFLRATPHYTATQQARHLGRSKASVQQHRHAIGIRITADVRREPSSVGRRRLLAKTCTGCGLLLDASWFGRRRGQQWNSLCSRCKNERCTNSKQKYAEKQPRDKLRERQKSARTKLQALSLTWATRSGEPYIGRDDETLRDPDLSIVEKAIKLGRSYLATEGALRKRGYTSRVGRGDPTKAQWIINLAPEVAAQIQAAA